jgi:uncharacterized phage protein (TIGR01671 family)
MREIKFRAWDTERKKMTISFTLQEVFVNGGDGYARSLWDNRKHLEIMQFTGLKDKNGKEIYEGGLVMVGEEVMSVFWYEQSSAFWLLHLNPQDKSDYHASSGVPARDWNWLDGGRAVNWHNNPKIAVVEVIGNIYENPELIKVAETNSPHA